MKKLFLFLLRLLHPRVWPHYLFILAWICGFVWLNHAWVDHNAKGRVFFDSASVPANRVGLVLGTSKNTGRGGTNIYFKNRMEAAARLYKRGKIERIIVSGDNSIKGYDEPTDMKNYLVALGVPAKHIVCDYAGFRTLDSVVRCKSVFGQSDVTIISQNFHNERALFIADHVGLNAVCYNAQSVPRHYDRLGKVRELLARTKCVVDLYFLGTQPKFLGESVAIV